MNTGATAGILTLEDLIEEIVGEIRDEYDTNEEDEITKIDDENFILLGIAKLDDINDELGIDLESEDYDSIAGHTLICWIIFRKPGKLYRINTLNTGYSRQPTIVLIK